MMRAVDLKPAGVSTSSRSNFILRMYDLVLESNNANQLTMGNGQHADRKKSNTTPCSTWDFGPNLDYGFLIAISIREKRLWCLYMYVAETLRMENAYENGRNGPLLLQSQLVG